MGGSIDPRCETVRGTHWPKKVAWLFGARVAETILASGPKSPHQQAGHMDASDPIRPSKKLLWHGGRPHMGPRFRGAFAGTTRDKLDRPAFLLRRGGSRPPDKPGRLAEALHHDRGQILGLVRHAGAGTHGVAVLVRKMRGRLALL